jgi:hypothetical protein
MNDDAVSPDQRARNRRLFGGMIGWLLSEDRRPGMTGAAVAFRGRMEDGAASLTRFERAWELVSPARQELVENSEVIRLIGAGAFFPLTVDIIPDLAELLFKEAVHQAEISVARVDAARLHIEELSESDLAANPLPWVMATSELDRSVRASIASVVLSIAAGEAQVNRWIDVLGGWSKDEDRLGVAEKCKALAARRGHVISLGSTPYQGLQRAVQRRNAFVHSMPVPEAVPAFGARTAVPGHSISVEARATCLAVRSSFIDLARLLEVPIPAYLAYCPPGPPDDNESWSSASVMTGSRVDPDFPYSS